MYRIDPARRDLVAAFMRDPLGAHSPELQMMLNVLRTEPMAGRHVLLCVVPHRRWLLGRLPGTRRGEVEVVPGYEFDDLAEAERAVFRLRWQRLTGESLA